MPRRKEFSFCTARARKLADKELDEHISEAEVAECANEVYGDLYAIVCGGADAYFQSVHSFAATGAASYAEPDDHLSTIALELVASSGERTPLKKLLAQERYQYGGFSGTDVESYSLIDDQIWLYPPPASGNLELLYIPQPPDLTTYADADELDLVNSYGEQFFMYGVAALIKSKSEDDVRFFLDRQARAEKMLEVWVARRSFHDARRTFNGIDYSEVNG